MYEIKAPTGRDFLEATQATDEDFSRVCFLIQKCAFRDGVKAFDSLSEVMDQDYATLRALEMEVVSKMEPPVPDP